MMAPKYAVGINLILDVKKPCVVLTPVALLPMVHIEGRLCKVRAVAERQPGLQCRWIIDGCHGVEKCSAKSWMKRSRSFWYWFWACGAGNVVIQGHACSRDTEEAWRALADIHLLSHPVDEIDANIRLSNLDRRNANRSAVNCQRE